ncbi:MAG: hypothetical protein NXH95_19270 [Pseudomonadaceae bacterium]|nr:hypothetical protein [Pseudomonadaceae bacterium]
MNVLITLKTGTYTLLLCLLLSACGGDSSNKASTPTDNSVETLPEPEPEPVAEPDPKTEPEPEPINLSSELLDDIVDEGVDGSINPRERLLPNLFEPAETDRKTKLRGGLLINEEPEQIKDMLEGVEVQIEIPTG